MRTYGTVPVQEEADDGSGVERAATLVSSGKHERDNRTITPPLDDDARSVMSERSHESAQAGVKRLEAISSTWSKTGLYVAYVGIALLAYATSLEGQTTTNLTIFATSAFKSHSLVSTVLVIQGVVLSIVKPPMSKIADVFGRFEAFGLSVLLYIVGFIQQAASNNVETYAAAQIFYAAGQTGLQILIQIFIADTSDLINRALCSTIPDTPFLLNVWLGPALAETMLNKLNWRWGYGIWAVILPIAFLPLALALVINQRRAAMRGILPTTPFAEESWWEMIKTLWFELDLFGLLLICVAFTLILIPLTLGAKTGWDNPSLITMLVVGAACLVAIPFWERSKTLAPRAFFPRSFWKNRTLMAGLALSFFYFMAFYLSVYPYFQSYLLVVQDLPLTQAGRIVQTFTFTSTITAIIISFVIKYTKRYKIYIVIGTVVYVIGLGLMIIYRTEESTPRTIIATQVFLGIGGSLTHVPAQLGVQASASHSEVAAATALFLTFLEIGGAVGSGISGAIWTSNVPKKLAMYLPEETKDQAAEIFGNITLASRGWPMGSPTRIAINLAYQEAMTNILTVSIFVALPCIVLSLLMTNYKLDEIDQGVKGVVIGGTQDGVDNREEPIAGPSTSRLSRESTRLMAISAEEEDDEEDGENEERQDSRSRLLGSRKRS
ncbi:MFS siderochrome iron transporter C [Fulvia fulva]|nr:MFS siderochrome iron transporter C [Fulvia fulva]